MKRFTWDKKVENIENISNTNPKMHKLKVWLLILLGYAYIWFFLLSFVILLSFFIRNLYVNGFHLGEVKLLVLVAILLFFIIKSFFIKENLPNGFYLQPEDAPYLFQTILEIQNKLHSEKIHFIALDTQFNAYVTAHFRFGLFGPRKNVLVIGLPLLIGLSSEQFKSVLAHELSHICHADTLIGTLSYRLLNTWSNLTDSLNRDNNIGRHLFNWYAKWFFPTFDAYSFPLRRAAEYLADKKAASLTNVEDKGEALINISIKAQYYNDFLKALYEDTLKTSTLQKPYSLFSHCVNAIPKERQMEYLEISLNREKVYSDTHPTLKERLDALGYTCGLPKNFSISAAEVFLANVKETVHLFDNDWEAVAGSEWLEDSELHKQYTVLKEKEDLTLSELWEKGCLVEKFDGIEKAIDIFKMMIKDFPSEKETAGAYIKIGEHFLHQRNEKGIELIRNGFSLNWKWKLYGLQVMMEYYLSIKNLKKYNKTDKEKDKWEIKLIDSNNEVNSFHKKDIYVPHDIDKELVNTELSKLIQFSEIQEVYFVKKKLKRIPEREFYILGVLLGIEETYNDEIMFKFLQDKMDTYISTFDIDAYYTVVILNELEFVQENLMKSGIKPLYKRM